MNNALLKSFQTLQVVYQDRAFSTIALNKTLNGCFGKEKPLVTKVVYGVLDNDVKLQYVIGKFVKKLPKGDVLLYLKIGTYCLMELSMPIYAVVNDVAELSKLSGDKRTVGFVNATLKSMASADVKNFADYPQDFAERLSAQYSYPLWSVKKIIKDYDKEEAERIISAPPNHATTIRIACSKEDFLAKHKEACELLPTVFDDVFYLQGRLPKVDETFTPQSLSSVAIAKICANAAKENFFDCCSAPGGKAVCVAGLRQDLSVVACDVHPHRVELIDSYASRMGVRVQTHCQDMTVFCQEWQGKFDTVLCDVPCSGFGVLDSRPDIKLFRQNEDISSLMKLQQAILQNCSNYVSVGGSLVYSTCTLFHNENEQNIRKFLQNNPNFTLGSINLPQLPNVHGKPHYQFLPHVDGMQGFFVCVLTRIQ